MVSDRPTPIEVRETFGRVHQDATHAHVYFHTWWALFGVAMPEHRATMGNVAYVDFFQACKGFLTLVFVSLGRLLDHDQRSLGLKRLHEVLVEHGYGKEGGQVDSLLSSNGDLIERIRRIRNKAAAHTDREMTREDVYEKYGVTPNEIRDLVGGAVDVVNDVEQSLYSSGLLISSGERQERATMSLLRCLKDAAWDDGV